MRSPEAQAAANNLETTELRLLFEALKLFTLEPPARPDVYSTIRATVRPIARQAAPGSASILASSGSQLSRPEALLELLQRHTALQRGFCAAPLPPRSPDSPGFPGSLETSFAAKPQATGFAAAANEIAAAAPERAQPDAFFASGNSGSPGNPAASANPAWLGLSPAERESAARSLREGVIGRAMSGGQAILLPKGRAEPLFLNRSDTLEVKKSEIFLICVPVLLAGRCLGALGADRLFPSSTPLEEDVRLLRLLAGLLAQAAQARQSDEATRQALLAENRRLQKQVAGPITLAGYWPASLAGSARLAASSQAMRPALEEAALAAQGQAPLLLLGESGSGKESLAALIHAESARAGRPFVVFNCSALPPGSLESELFGSERGAFAGSAVRPGCLESAQGGTLFLDDVSELPATAQARLLRAVEMGEFTRLGGSAPLPLDFRLIAASELSLEELSGLVEPNEQDEQSGQSKQSGQGRWRPDFYRCLALNAIYLPPLRKRKDDILPLVNRLLESSWQRGGRKITRLSPAAVGLLMSYPWPGNLRELENVIERAVMLSGESEVIESRHLPPWLQRGVEGTQPARSVGSATPGALPGELLVRKGSNLDESLNAAELALLEESLARQRGNMARAAQELGISQRIMGLRMKKHGLDYRKFRQK